MVTPTPYPESLSVKFTYDGLELPIDINDLPIERMDLAETREQLLLARERLSQFEVTLEKLVAEFDRNLGALCTLPSLGQAKVLLGHRK